MHDCNVRAYKKDSRYFKERMDVVSYNLLKNPQPSTNELVRGGSYTRHQARVGGR